MEAEQSKGNSYQFNFARQPKKSSHDFSFGSDESQDSNDLSFIKKKSKQTKTDTKESNLPSKRFLIDDSDGSESTSESDLNTLSFDGDNDDELSSLFSDSSFAATSDLKSTIPVRIGKVVPRDVLTRINQVFFFFVCSLFSSFR
jgi:hypothetical protein